MVPSGHAGGTKLRRICTDYKRCKQVGKASKSVFFSVKAGMHIISLIKTVSSVAAKTMMLTTEAKQRC